MSEGVPEKLPWGISSILPIGNYVKIDEVKKLIGEPVYIKENGCCVLLSGDSVHVELGAGGDSASVTTLGRTFSMDGGLVVSAKDIEIGGEGAFNGLFMAAGQISVTGSARLTAPMGRLTNPFWTEKRLQNIFMITAIRPPLC